MSTRKLTRAPTPDRARFSIEVTDSLIMLEDLDQGRTVTNDADAVIADLAQEGLLRGRRVIYRDTMGRWDELLHDGTRFTGFRPFTQT